MRAGDLKSSRKSDLSKEREMVMAEERSMTLYCQVSEAEQKFEYFLTGLIGALCGYVGQNFVSAKLGLNPSTIELVAILILVVSFCCSMWCILLHTTIKGLNADALHINETKQKLIVESKLGQPRGPTDNNLVRDNSTGKVIHISQVAEGVEQMSKLEQEIMKRIGVSQIITRGVRFCRAFFLVVGFLTLLSSRVFKAYAVPSESVTGKCAGIPNGDTTKVMHNGVDDRSRLGPINGSGSQQSFGTKAK